MFSPEPSDMETRVKILSDISEEQWLLRLKLKHFRQPLHEMDDRLKVHTTNKAISSRDHPRTWMARSFITSPSLGATLPADLIYEDEHDKLVERGECQQQNQQRLTVVEKEVEEIGGNDTGTNDIAFAEVLLAGSIRVNNHFVNLQTYLESEACHVHERSLLQPTITAMPLHDLVTGPSPQLLACKEGLKILAASDFKGGFLDDVTGSCKLAALLAALEVQGSVEPDRGFILVVCKPNCVGHWRSELTKHWNEDDRPSCILLDQADVKVARLLEYRIVICTTTFLEQRYMGLGRQENIDLIARIEGPERAMSLLELTSSQMQRLPMPLHSELYRLDRNKIAALIVDEAYDYRDPTSKLHAAVRALHYKAAFLLTNDINLKSWQDFPGQLALLPGGGPFPSLTHYRRTFGISERTGEMELDDESQARLKRLMGGLIIGNSV